MPKRSLLGLSAAMIGLLAAHPAAAGEQASGRLKITVRVPPSCSLDSSPVILDQDSQFVSSTFFESCNTNRGFQIVATHRPLAATERANVSFDGIQSSLNAGGLSFVQFRQGARHGPIAVNVAAESLDAPLAVSFAMTPV